MKEIKAQQITECVKKLCINACCVLPCDVRDCIQRGRDAETWAPAKEILDHIIDNYHIAEDNMNPICQDTGIAVIFAEVGREVYIEQDQFIVIITRLGNVLV